MQTLPKDENSEQSVLVSILIDKEHRSKAFEQLTANDFYTKANKIIFEKCRLFGSNSGEIKTVDIYNALDASEKNYVKASYLYNLIDTVPLAVNIEDYVSRLKETASRRKTIELANAIQKKCSNPDHDGATTEDLARQIINLSITKSDDQISGHVLPFETVVNLKLPPKRVFLDPWITEQSITLISGWRGTGKTWLAMSILDAISRGKPFGPWETETPVPTMYLDGEMTIQDMQYRAKQLQMGQDCKAPIYLYSDSYATSQGFPRANLLNELWRKQMKSFLHNQGIKLWVIDNIASLAPGINENAKDEWDPINEYLLSLRFSGIATILLHHVGKAGLQRGTSAREDNIDTSIILKQPDDYETEDGCRFVMTFKKNRVICGDHFLLADQEFQYHDGQWSFENAKTKTKNQILEMLNNGAKNKDIATTLGVSPAYVSKVKKDRQFG